MLGERSPETIVVDLEFEIFLFAARHSALNAVGIIFVTKSVDHFGSFRLQVDERIIPFASLPKKHPGDGIEQRRFPRAVMPGNAGKVERLKIEFDGLAVGEKAGNFQRNWDHGEIIPCV